MKRKNKALKTFGFTSLAMLMGIAGTMAFAPLASTNAKEQPTTTTGLGLDPKNDPVVYTTESGLEIKMSNTNSIIGSITGKTNHGLSYTQDLSGFYYFTMGTYSGTIYTGEGGSTAAKYTLTNEPVNWIILGLGPNTSYFLDEVTANLFSTWETNTSGLNPDYTNGIANGPYFFQEVFENTSPAGKLIDSTVSAKTYIMEKVKASIPLDPADEIPAGCMLVISERILGQCGFNSSITTINYSINTSHTTSHILCTYFDGSKSRGDRYRYYGNYDTNQVRGQSWNTSSNAGGTLYNYINNLFSKNTSGTILENGLGFTQEQADLIVPQQLYTYYSNGPGYNYQETPSTDGNTYYTMFPIAYRAAYSSIYQNFCIEDYLNTNTRRVTFFIGSSTYQPYFWWTRSASPSHSWATYTVEPNGTFRTSGVGNGDGVRPAMVMKLQ